MEVMDDVLNGMMEDLLENGSSRRAKEEMRVAWRYHGRAAAMLMWHRSWPEYLRPAVFSEPYA